MILFFGIWTLYLCLGFSLSGHNQPTMDIYMGADNSRAWDDLMVYSGVFHYRIKVHPLMLLLLQPVTLLVQGLIHNPQAALVIVESLVGAVSVYWVYRMLERSLIDRWIAVLIVLVYGASFSNLLFATIPETFLFAGMFLVLFWSYVCYSLGVQKISREMKLILFFFGIACFGITITNYMQFLIGLFAVLFFAKAERREKIRTFFQITIGNAVAVLGLAGFQKFAWKDGVSFFLSSYRGLVDGSGSFEEFQYTDNRLFSLKKILLWLDQIFQKPLISAEVEQVAMREDYHPVLFADNYRVADVLILAFYGILIGSVIWSLIKNVRRRELLMLSAALLFNGVLHFFYGFYEAFIYTPHFLFLVILLFGMSTDSLPKTLKRLVIGFLAVFLAVELFVNLSVYRELIKIVAAYMGTAPYSVKGVFLKTIAGMCLVFGAVLLGRRQCRKYTVTCHGAKVSAQTKILWAIGIYGTIVLTSACFIRLSL